MRLFVGGIATETNGFSPVPTDMAAFEEFGIRRRETPDADPALVSLMLGAITDVAQAESVEIIEGLIAAAEPAGPVEAPTWHSLRDELLANLRASDAEAALFVLHGAMVAEDCEDCEGEVLIRAREILGPERAIGVVFDPHAHLTVAMVEAADILVAFKEYPHTDTAEAAGRAARLTIAASRGTITPRKAVYDCRMIGLWPTDRPETRSIVTLMRALEEEGTVLSISFIHGFPWADVREGGAKVLVITDGDEIRAHEVASQIGSVIWAARASAGLGALALDDALDAIVDTRLVVLGDAADNPGGGAPGNSSFILKRILERGMANVALGAFCLGNGARDLLTAVPGSSVEITIGEETGSASGPRLVLDGILRAAVPDLQQTAFGGTISLGAAAWVELPNKIDIVVAERRQQVLGPDVFITLGIDLASKRAVVVKSAQHFCAGFAEIASAMHAVDTPGALNQNFAAIAYRKRNLNYWPRVADPFVKAQA
jgi:microcystin degradation protein MlrC